MALTETTNPRLNISGYDSDAASTTQLRYVYNESDLTNIDKYFLEVVIPELSGVTLYYFPDSSGNIEFDVGRAVQLAMPANSIKYHLEVTPYRDGSAETGITSLDILAVKSKVQILSEYGSNLYDYIIKTPNPAQWMTIFQEPKLWNGWDKTLYAINMDIAASVDVIQNSLDINKAFLAANDTTQILAGAPAIDGWPLSYPATANAYYIEVGFELTGSDITEKKIIKLEPECREPIMIEWLNSLGVVENWLFQIEQAVINTSEQGLMWETPIADDISTVQTTKQRFSEKDTQFITVKAAHLNQNELQGLHDIKRSEAVRVWLLKDGSEWVSVRVSAGYETTFTTGKNNYEFSLSIEFPDNFDFFKAKKY
jgi:hypothetical protein